MREWLFKATPKKIPFGPTRDLAVEEGFICRSAYEGNLTKADNTRKVRLGDLIHFYFAEDATATIIGTYEVVGPRRHPHPELYGQGATGTALHAVKEPLASRLGSLGGTTGEGYAVDPVLKQMAGWFVIPRTDVETPPYHAGMFPGRGCLFALSPDLPVGAPRSHRPSPVRSCRRLHDRSRQVGPPCPSPRRGTPCGCPDAPSPCPRPSSMSPARTVSFRRGAPPPL